MLIPSEFFSMLADETRLRCLLLLARKDELCVCELEHILESSQPKISRHLALLRKSGLVTHKKRGKWVYYCINPDLPEWAKEILKTTSRAIEKENSYFSDLEKVKSLRQQQPCV
jgi:ArsR family transcriptional regulator